MRALMLRTIRAYLLKRELRASCSPTWRHAIRASSEVESGESATWSSSTLSHVGSGANRAGKKEFTSLSCNACLVMRLSAGLFSTWRANFVFQEAIGGTGGLELLKGPFQDQLG